MDTGGGSDDAEAENRHLRRLVSSIRAHGGVGAISAGCHHDVTGIDGVVLAVIAAHAGRITFSDSGPHGELLEDLYATLDQGPGIDAAVNGEPVAAADLRHADARSRWPRFAEQALGDGIGAVFAYPVILKDRPVGVLSAYRGAPGALSTADDDQIQRYAQATSVVLLDDWFVSDSGAMDVVLPVQTGEVQQAVGIVMELAGIDAAAALHRLRAYARRSARPMREVVADVRASRMPFDPTEPA